MDKEAGYAVLCQFLLFGLQILYHSINQTKHESLRKPLGELPNQILRINRHPVPRSEKETHEYVSPPQQHSSLSPPSLLTH